jgi:hypothetical protein
MAALFGVALTTFVATPAFASATYIGAFTFTKNSSAPDHSTLNLIIREIINGVRKPPTIKRDHARRIRRRDHRFLREGPRLAARRDPSHSGRMEQSPRHHHHWRRVRTERCVLRQQYNRADCTIHPQHVPWSANEYFSQGCIKVNNTDIDTLFNDYKAYFPGRQVVLVYSTPQVRA